MFLDSHILSVCLWLVYLPSKQLIWVWFQANVFSDICKNYMPISSETGLTHNIEIQVQAAILMKHTAHDHQCGWSMHTKD